MNYNKELHIVQNVTIAECWQWKVEQVYTKRKSANVYTVFILTL